jgi:hypothetical protein
MRWSQVSNLAVAADRAAKEAAERAAKQAAEAAATVDNVPSVSWIHNIPGVNSSAKGFQYLTGPTYKVNADGVSEKVLVKLGDGDVLRWCRQNKVRCVGGLGIGGAGAGILFAKTRSSGDGELDGYGEVMEDWQVAVNQFEYAEQACWQTCMPVNYDDEILTNGVNAYPEQPIYRTVDSIVAGLASAQLDAATEAKMRAAPGPLCTAADDQPHKECRVVCMERCTGATGEGVWGEAAAAVAAEQGASNTGLAVMVGIALVAIGGAMYAFSGKGGVNEMEDVADDLGDPGDPDDPGQRYEQHLSRE